MTATLAYYNQNAEAFFTDTVGVDMSAPVAAGFERRADTRGQHRQPGADEGARAHTDQQLSRRYRPRSIAHADAIASVGCAGERSRSGR